MFAKRSVLPLMLAMFVGVLVSAMVPEPTAAQGCGWCEEKRDWKKLWLKKKHWFPGGNNSCGSSNRTENCARCGTDLGCHTEEDDGECHIACGPAGEPTALLDAVEEVRTLLDASDVTLAAAVVLIDRADLTIAYQPAGGRINFTLPCDPAIPAATVAVLPGVRVAFEEALAASSRAVVTLEPLHDRVLAVPW